MTIHHAIAKKAEKAGILLTDCGAEEHANQRYKAHWPEYNQIMFGGNPKYLLDDMMTVKVMRKEYASFDVKIEDDDTVTIKVRGTDIVVSGMRAVMAFPKAKAAWMESRADLDIDDEEADAEVEAEIDEAHAEDEEERQGSVVSSTYRAKYAEAGHPAHCGDWLANVLNEYCLNDAGFNTIRFEAICEMNGVDLSKYNRTTRGWQGRLRMTGRNLLGRKIAIKGTLTLPDKEVAVDEGWRALQKYAAPRVQPTPTTPKKVN